MGGFVQCVTLGRAFPSRAEQEEDWLVAPSQSCLRNKLQINEVLITFSVNYSEEIITVITVENICRQRVHVGDQKRVHSFVFPITTSRPSLLAEQGMQRSKKKHKTLLDSPRTEHIGGL